jgi:hypothetical protein
MFQFTAGTLEIYLIFGASYLGDNGSAITCLIKTHFLAARQQTNESQYRRFYLDVDPIIGFTQPISVNFSSNYGSSTVVSRTMYQNPFQSRVDFGIPARSIQATIYHASATLSLKVTDLHLRRGSKETNEAQDFTEYFEC